ncbi:hypothetical protein M427DRAFT_32889 [Gonapodya prolifera JEL478]|uniref:Uncharacterized protein n=1 Tax=Gonapodya prolifera (strain JEL478) TaxID=1344416 RepID=A0A139AD06_GONPJ|nr:hypothetical protein M427DRAFT_32889 [Gonapodya prolifera JEL478]|eukprot:KXS14681.1 hypothetical protein M427DRAFT_32889 [Gonapodya prolifera JEL478]
MVAGLGTGDTNGTTVDGFVNWKISVQLSPHSELLVPSELEAAKKWSERDKRKCLAPSSAFFRVPFLAPRSFASLDFGGDGSPKAASSAAILSVILAEMHIS